jgi:hypothetical protein
VSIIRDIRELKKDDTHLARLFDKVQEYAELYLIAKQRQKGCDEIGEVATLKDDLKCIIEEMINYCKKQGYILEDIAYDIDSIADEIVKIND